MNARGPGGCARVERREGLPHGGWFTLDADRFPCALGPAGISADKTEGDLSLIHI